MLDVSEAVLSPDLGVPQGFTVLRSAGSFVMGVWKMQQTQIPMQGVISAASDTEMDMIPEGDRILGAMVIHTDQPILTTQDIPANPGGTQGYSSDIIVLSDTSEKYRVLRVSRIPGSGFYKAIAYRMSTGA